MPNAVKYKTGNLTGSLQKGNVALGVSGSLGPTSTAGWYNGPNVVANKYQIFETAASGDPDVYCPQDDAELIKFARWKGATGADTGSAAAVLAWIATQPNLMATNFEYPSIVTDSLVLNLDAGFVGSYPTIGTPWFDISGNSNSGTLTNGPTFNSANSGSIVFDGIDDYASITNSTSLNMGNKSFSGEVWIKIPNSVVSERMIFEYNIWGNSGTYQLTLITNSTIRVNWPETYNQGKYLDYEYLPITQNNWTHLVGQYDRDTDIIKLFINGVLVSQVTGAIYEIGNVTSTMYIMSRGGTSLFLTGNLAIFRMYNKALSSNEVLQNYNAQKGRFGL